MYKLFLCLKYLRRRYLAIIAVLAVALCVFMVLVTVSVMDGFLRQVQLAAKGLYGDIVVESTSLSGIGRYDEFISRLTGEYHLDAGFVAGKREDGQVVYRVEAPLAHVEALNRRPGLSRARVLKVEQPRTYPARAALFRNGRKAAELTGPLTLTTDRMLEFAPEGLSGGEGAGPQTRLGALYVKVGEPMDGIEAVTPAIYTYGLLRIEKSFTTMVRISGIRLPERLAVTDFEDGLFVQAGQNDANFDPSLELVRRRLDEHAEMIADALQRETQRPQGRRDAKMIGDLRNALMNVEGRIASIENAVAERKLIEQLQLRLRLEEAKPESRRDKKLIAELNKQIGIFTKSQQSQFLSPADRVILGLGIAGLSFRTPEGEAVRLSVPGRHVLLSLLPMGRGRFTKNITPATWTFVVADDAKTGVYHFDSKTVYVPFDNLQRLAAMDERGRIDDPADVDPARCSQIQIKVRPEFATRSRLSDVAEDIEEAWADFEATHGYQAASSRVIVQTWREKLAKFIGPIQKQRSLVALMFGIISLVAVLLVFAIFYMIVMQKIRDIGIIRAVGGSGGGIAQIFLAYGAVTGLVGSLLGLLGGWLFVRYINEIEDVLYLLSGERVWDREVFLFDKIPNEVDPRVMAVIAAWAMASGLVGALIPAIWAATMRPAEAVRYE
ncbi:MAG: ABC transporter permease [Planctomycetota bacterium]|jgi:ABC-type lipoprotein release transport system permease subunit